MLETCNCSKAVDSTVTVTLGLQNLPLQYELSAYPDSFYHPCQALPLQALTSRKWLQYIPEGQGDASFLFLSSIPSFLVTQSSTTSELSLNLSPRFTIPKALKCALLVDDFHWRWEWPTQRQIWLSHQTGFLHWYFLTASWFLFLSLPTRQLARAIYPYNVPTQQEVSGWTEDSTIVLP